KAEGLNALVVIMQNQVVVNGVLSRHVDYGGTFSNFVGAAMSGAPARIVMSVMDGADHFLVTSPNIKRVEDLKGKTFGISSFGGTPHSEAVAILRKYGLNPEKDVTFLQVGGSSARYLALESGSIQAAMIVPPFNHLAKKRGFNQILGFNDIMSMPVGGLAVHTQKMKEKPDEIVKMIRALIKSLEFIRTRKPDILAIIDKHWGVKEADVREEMYREMLGLFSRNGIPSDEAMRNVIRLVRESRKNASEVGIADVADWSFARKAQ
ncbi:MAG TPA: ABC transporter substrate-binding protein, partial [Candidatus Deferrimicrobium sp.]|nr:ABC transporter substrate-binding protein [Candidatus Deferrimicrobium sp.]